ncbi:hypothetical protein GQ600_4684 [Phytophthora cactorum]|nr:hypothetical protein GQ600_4684 [Phytophthora cactorum]
MQSAAEEFVEVMGKCRAEIESSVLKLGTGIRTTRRATRSANIMIVQGTEVSGTPALELEFAEVLSGALTLVCTAAQLVTAHDEYELQERTTGERINALGSNMLENMDSFCYALEAIMVQSLRGQGDLAGPAREWNL